jgi:1-acyl-sn-glycerol-3-phosphate acyltransferase
MLLMKNNFWLCVAFVRYVAAWSFTLGFSFLAVLSALFIGPSRMWTTFCRPWARTTLWILGIRPIIHGQHKLNGPGVFIANHQSLLDVVLLPAVLPSNVRFVARRSLRRVPIWGWAFMMGGAIPIERRGKGGDTQRLAAGLKKLPKGWSVTVFPEGTRNTTGQLGPFRRGAFVCAAQLNYPIVPIGVSSFEDVAPNGHWLLRAGTVQVYAGEPLTVTNTDQETLTQVASQARQMIATCINLARRTA